MGGAWGDLDNDGDLDLAVTHPAGFVPGAPTTNHLYLNNGAPNYTFTRVTTGPIVTGLSSYTVGTWSDYDNDGDIDYFVGAGPANGTTQPDFLYRNLLKETGTATFERITDAPIATDQQDGQVWNWIDYDNDGDLDAYVTNWGGATGGWPTACTATTAARSRDHGRRHRHRRRHLALLGLGRLRQRRRPRLLRGERQLPAQPLLLEQRRRHLHELEQRANGGRGAPRRHRRRLRQRRRSRPLRRRSGANRALYRNDTANGTTG